MDFLTTSRVAHRLEASEASVRNWADAGRLRVVAKLPDGTRLFDPREVARFAHELRNQRGAHSERPLEPAEC
jgi:hypothetical protein